MTGGGRREDGPEPVVAGPEDADQGPGWVLPGYRIGPVLGCGGFATVYRAHQLSLARDVAIKVLATDLAAEGDRRRFERERRALTALSPHPHVADVFDAGVTAERHPYLVMRLYSGGTLADRLARCGRLPVGEVVDVVTAVASALDAAHGLGILHRDVKPQNVLLTETGDPVLADFGIAGIVGPAPAGPSTSTIFFSFAHVAPEILEHRRYSIASDVYALASTTYQLLTGAPAFDPDDPRVSTLILDTSPAPIVVPGVPSALADAVLAGMAKNPADRPATAGAFAATLASAWSPAAARSPEASAGPSRAAAPGRPSRSRVVAAAAVAGLLAIGGGGFYLVSQVRADRPGGGGAAVTGVPAPASSAGGTSPPTTTAPTAVSAVPVAYRGLWNLRPTDCSDEASEGRLVVEAGTVTFHESVGRVAGVILQGDRISVTLELSGEGETWEETQTWALSPDGATLTDVTTGATRLRCP